MNAAFLLMSSAALVGAQPAPAAPAPAAPAAPVVISSGNGCSNCGTPVHYSDCGGCSKPGLLDRLRSRFGKKSCDCAPPCPPPCNPCPPKPCPPPPPCNPCPPPCDPCHKTCANRPNLFDTLKSRWGSKKSCAPACDPCGSTHSISGGCAAPLPAGAAPVAPAPAPGAPPKEMPKGPAKEPGKGGNPTGAPAPITGAGGAGLTAPHSPY